MGLTVQYILVFLIGAAVIFKVLHGIYTFFFTKKENNFCGSCRACDFHQSHEPPNLRRASK